MKDKITMVVDGITLTDQRRALLNLSAHHEDRRSAKGRIIAGVAQVSISDDKNDVKVGDRFIVTFETKK